VVDTLLFINFIITYY